ncbi:hypothetical protein [Brevibacterium sp.]|nr:hypothetical protein [Brevibacterium sp.]
MPKAGELLEFTGLGSLPPVVFADDSGLVADSSGLVVSARIR